ncbi:hypothetical protein WJX74_005862 [Apatococcus lobatus]|uniref:cysteine dioxygenase n=1 Tax=Apatococcus lobatus TaxID=904363 RepID=A0AAW1S2I7_9CHLO
MVSALHSKISERTVHTNAGSSKLQQLYSTAKSTLSGAEQPGPAEVDKLKAALAAVPLHELGLQKPIQDPPKGWFHKRQSRAPPITYLHVHEDSDISIGIFCLPANASLPLHNHPGMTVLSRVLYGSMQVRGLDLVPREEHATDGSDPVAAVALETVLDSSSQPAVLFPKSGGNIHQFTAVTPCAVLDVLSPPYSPGTGRDCTYYAEQPVNSNKVALKEVQPPAEFMVKSARYLGLQIDPHGR